MVKCHHQIHRRSNQIINRRLTSANATSTAAVPAVATTFDSFKKQQEILFFQNKTATTAFIKDVRILRSKILDKTKQLSENGVSKSQIFPDRLL